MNAATTVTATDQPAAGAQPTRIKAIARSLAPLAGIAVLAVFLLVIAPGVLSPFRLNNLGKYVCYGIAAVGIGIAWGRGGMLVLGQGLFFGIGAYCMGMHLKLEAAGPGGVPDFMLNFGNGPRR